MFIFMMHVDRLSDDPYKDTTRNKSDQSSMTLATFVLIMNFSELTIQDTFASKVSPKFIIQLLMF